MKKHIWTQDYKITSYLVNLRGEAGLFPMLNFIQDVGWQHAMHLEVKLPKHLSWVFTRQKVVMHEWPKWNETILLKTWLRQPQSEQFLVRDYEIYRGDRLLGMASATFTVIDLTTRKIAAIKWPEINGHWQMLDHCLPLHPEKILFKSENVEKLTEFQVRNSDLDLNMHVNNTKYAQWILDALPIDTLVKGPYLNSYEVNFLAEAKLGDLVHIQLANPETTSHQHDFYQFQGQRQSDGKPIFTTLLGARKDPK